MSGGERGGCIVSNTCCDMSVCTVGLHQLFVCECLAVCLPVCRSVSQSLSVHASLLSQSACLPACLSIVQSVCLSVCHVHLSASSAFSHLLFNKPLPFPPQKAQEQRSRSERLDPSPYLRIMELIDHKVMKSLSKTPCKN